MKYLIPFSLLLVGIGFSKISYDLITTSDSGVLALPIALIWLAAGLFGFVRGIVVARTWKEN